MSGCDVLIENGAERHRMKVKTRIICQAELLFKVLFKMTALSDINTIRETYETETVKVRRT